MNKIIINFPSKDFRLLKHRLSVVGYIYLDVRRDDNVQIGMFSSINLPAKLKQYSVIQCLTDHTPASARQHCSGVPLFIFVFPPASS